MEKKDFFDEQIIDMVNRSEKKETAHESAAAETDRDKNSIYSGIRIQGKQIYFERRSLAEETVTMMVPKNFSQMSPDMARKKYPSEYRAETILTNEMGTVNLMFQYMEGEVSDTDIENFRNQVFGMMKRVNPGIRERELGHIDAAGKRIAYAEFSNPAMDGKLYNLMFFLAVDGQPLMGSFNCQTKEMKYWRQAAFEMVGSVEMAGPEEQED